jgi:hypothetical protein
MTIRIKHEGLAGPVSPMFTLYIADLLDPYKDEKSVTINFRNPNHTSDDGGYHPVEIRLENEGDGWCFCYVDCGYMAELAKDLGFDKRKIMVGYNRGTMVNCYFSYLSNLSVFDN